MYNRDAAVLLRVNSADAFPTCVQNLEAMERFYEMEELQPIEDSNSIEQPETYRMILKGYFSQKIKKV